MKAIRPPGKGTTLWIYDTAQLYGVQRAASDAGGEVRSTNYKELGAVLSERLGPLDAAEPGLIYAPVAIDPRSDAQRRFLAALEQMNVHPDGIDYRHAFVSNPGGVFGEKPDKPVSSLAPWIAHAIGLMSRHPSPTVVLVSGAFESYYPLLDFTTKRGGRAYIAFFRRYLDARWGQFTGLLDPGFPIGWVDLEPDAARILGVDLGLPQPLSKPGSGLSAIL